MPKRMQTPPASLVARASRALSVSVTHLCLVLLLGCGGEREPDALTERVATTDWHSPPRLAAGATPTHLLALAPGSEAPEVLVFDAAGTVSARHALRMGSALQLLETRNGALALGPDSLTLLSADGSPAGAPHPLQDPPPGMLGRCAVAGRVLVLVSDDSNGSAVHVQLHRLDGGRIGHRVTFESDSFTADVAAAAVGPDRLAVAWQRNDGDTQSIIGAVLDLRGNVVSPARTLYRPAPGGAIQCCAAAARAGGGALLLWTDSSPGPWAPYGLWLTPEAQASAPVRANPGQGTDAMGITGVGGAGSRTIAYRGGIHWGAFARTGEGYVVMRATEREGTERRFVVPGESIESFAIAATSDRVLVLGSVVPESGAEIYAGVFGRR